MASSVERFRSADDSQLVELSNSLQSTYWLVEKPGDQLKNMEKTLNEVKKQGWLFDRMVKEVKQDEEHEILRKIGAVFTRFGVGFMSGAVSMELLSVVAVVSAAIGTAGAPAAFTPALVTALIVVGVISSILGIGVATYMDTFDPTVILSSEELKKKKNEIRDQLIKELAQLQLMQEVDTEAVMKALDVEIALIDQELQKVLKDDLKTHQSIAEQFGKQHSKIRIQEATEVLKLNQKILKEFDPKAEKEADKPANVAVV